MIKLTLAQVNENDFVRALMTLVNTARLEQKTAYRAGRVMAACKMAVERLREKEKVLITEKFQLKKDDGTALFDDDKMPTIDPGKKEEFLAAFKALAQSMTVEIKVQPIEFEHLQPAGLTPTQLIALEPILAGMPEDESGEAEVAG